MKKFLAGFVLLMAAVGCDQPPSTSNPTVTETLTLSSSTPSLAVSGVIYDISSPATFYFPSPNTTTGLPYSYNFTMGKHDTIYFTTTFSSACSFNYYISSAGVTTVQTPASTSTGAFTSPQLAF